MAPGVRIPMLTDATIRNRASKLRHIIAPGLRRKALHALRQTTGDNALEALPPSGDDRSFAIDVIAMTLLKEPVESVLFIHPDKAIKQAFHKRSDI